MHNIQYLTYPIKTSLDKIYKEISKIAEKDGDGLYYGLKSRQVTRDSYDDAMKWIEENDESYLNIAVPYFDYTDCKKSKKYEKMEQKVAKLNKKYKDEDSKVPAKDYSSKLYGCKNCESKLAVNFITSNKCPLCGSDLRSKTQLDKIAKYKENVNEARKELKKLEKEENKKNRQKAKEMWLVKFEYHS